MKNRLDHLVYAVPDLDEGISFIKDLLGIEVYPGGQHPRFGTHNAIVRIGNHTYLEIISSDPSNPKEFPLWMGISNVTSPGRLTRWAISHPLNESVMKGLKSYNEALAHISIGEREKPDGSTLVWKLTPPISHPMIESCPFFINWPEGIHPTTSLPMQCELTEIKVFSRRSKKINGFLNNLRMEFQLKQGDEDKIEAIFNSPKGMIRLN